MEFRKRLYLCLHLLKGEYGMNKIIQELNLPGGSTRPVLIMRKSKYSSTPTKEAEIQLELDIFKDVNFDTANKKE